MRCYACYQKWSRNRHCYYCYACYACHHHWSTPSVAAADVETRQSGLQGITAMPPDDTFVHILPFYTAGDLYHGLLQCRTSYCAYLGSHNKGASSIFAVLAEVQNTRKSKNSAAVPSVVMVPTIFMVQQYSMQYMGGFPYSIFNSPNDNHAYNIPLRAILSSFLTICKYNIHAERYRWASPHNGDGCRAQAALSILSRVPPSTSSTHRLYQALSLLRIFQFSRADFGKNPESFV